MCFFFVVLPARIREKKTWLGILRSAATRNSVQKYPLPMASRAHCFFTVAFFSSSSSFIFAVAVVQLLSLNFLLFVGVLWAIRCSPQAGLAVCIPCHSIAVKRQQPKIPRSNFITPSAFSVLNYRGLSAVPRTVTFSRCSAVHTKNDKQKKKEEKKREKSKNWTHGLCVREWFGHRITADRWRVFAVS